MMANTYCHGGYCDFTDKEREADVKATFADKLFIFGGYALLAAIVTAIVLYGASQGAYIDPPVLP